MDFNTSISLETKQILSQKQVESLNILSMPVTDLHEFLQNEEIENPLMEYSMADSSVKEEYTVRDVQEFYGGKRTDGDGDMEQFLSQMEDTRFSVEKLVMQQLASGGLSKEEQRMAVYAVNCLDGNGFLTVSPEEISEDLKLEMPVVKACLEKLKRLEPAGIFASGLEECLMIQAEGMEDEENLRRLISDHLNDIAEGRLNKITRALKISSVQARKLIAVIRSLNPRPLNGFAGGTLEYVIPDVIFRYGDGQWVVELNDRFGGHMGVNEFYVKMMETASDDELKKYFQEKLKRVRFIMNAVEQRKTTLIRIAEYILGKQENYFLNRGALRPMTLEEVAEAVSLNKSTISRAVKDKYISSPKGCVSMRSLFTAGVGDAGEGVSRNTAKDCLKALVDGEDKEKPYSDEKLALFLKEQGIDVSRRTVAKYRTELGIAGAFARKGV